MLENLTYNSLAFFVIEGRCHDVDLENHRLTPVVFLRLWFFVGTDTVPIQP